MYHNFININFLKKFDKFLKFINNQSFVGRHYWKNMDSVDLKPPVEIRGMVDLNRDAFKKQIKIPKLRISEEINLNHILPIIKTLLLKMENLKPIQTFTGTKTDNNDSMKLKYEHGDDKDTHNSNDNLQQNIKEILLHPLAVKNWNDIPKDIEKFGISEKNFCFETIELTYDNWKADEILKSILPNDKESLTSYSRIGHIVHVNLRDHLLPYKKIIGEILKDKVISCRTVIHKAQTIENTYRNFNLELICGEPNYEVEVKEHGCIFEFDFSKVYWNPRLSTEHNRIVNLLKPNDILYDVFAGVGPFSIPAAKKKKCYVLANDLNPESFKWLNVNVKKNKCSNLIQTFNKDGRQFILEEIRLDLLKRWKSKSNTNKKDYNIHITMNLPAMAVEFLNAFNNLFTKDDFNDDLIQNIDEISPLPLVHVYTFSKDENAEEKLKNIIEIQLGGYSLSDNLVGIYFVRNVAPNKDMYRISFYLTKEILFKSVTSTTPSLNKRKVSESLLNNSSDSTCNKKKFELQN